MAPSAMDNRLERAREQVRRRGRLLLTVSVAGLLTSACAMTANMGSTQIQVQSQAANGSDNSVAAGLELVFLLTLVSLLPTILIVMTSFTRIVIVLSFVRSAIGVPQLPPNQVLIGLSLFLTVFVMAPTWQAINRDALQPYLRGEIDQRTAFERGLQPLRDFMFRQTRERDIALFMDLGNLPRPRNPDEVPTWVLVPAFILSELKTAFTMGFVLFIPFLVIDLIVSSTLMAMGMIMVPPVVISLPFKLLLFVMVDGWDLLVRSLVASFGTG
ncbi:MAG: flagellar type III secretion system pore protein FliP [Thermomicrobium sp.]|nr:flagellar type III secretion system pore protein FliP [Thermomicrobium sp.]